MRSLLHASLNVEWGVGVLCASSTGFVKVLLVLVKFGIWACFSGAPLPEAFTGVAPKVPLGVTLGLHDICRFCVQLFRLLVLVTLDGVSVERIGPLPLIFV